MDTHMISPVKQEETARTVIATRIVQAFGEGTTLSFTPHPLLDLIEVRMWSELKTLEENRATFRIFYAWWEHFAKKQYPDHLLLLQEPEDPQPIETWLEEHATP